MQIGDLIIGSNANGGGVNAPATIPDDPVRIFQQIIDKSNAYLVYLDTDFNFVAVNSAYAKTCQREPHELIGKNHFFYYPNADNERIFNLVRASLKPISFHDKPFEFPDQPERGVTYWDWTLSPDIDTAGHLRGFVFSLYETTERKRLEKSLQETNKKLNRQLELVTDLKNQLIDQALRDSLTGLHNRRYFYEAMPGELIRARREGIPVSVILLDIDHFKKVNDVYGHSAGDEVLREISKLLHKARESDLSCRYGGEEFLLVMPGASLELALERAEDLRKQCEKTTISYNGYHIQVTISCGVAAFPKHGSNIDEILNIADNALYSAKESGRNRIAEPNSKKL